MKSLPIHESLTLPARELSWRAARSSGPGGQNVNKVETKVTLRFDLEASDVLTKAQKRRLRRLAGRRLDADGAVVISAQAERSQQQNLERARAALRNLILRALVVPKRRVPTAPTKAQKRKRLQQKRRQSEKKQTRGRVKLADD